MATAPTRRFARTLFALAVAAAGGLVLGPAARGAPLGASASVSPRVQYLNDKAGTTFTFTVQNTGTNGIGAVQITRPGTAWTVTQCFSAPPGWTATRRTGSACRYISAASTSDDLAPGAAFDFRLKATMGGGVANRVGTWVVAVSPSNRLDNPGILAGAGAESPGALDVNVYAFEVLDAVVTSAPATVGGACPTGAHAARLGSEQVVVVCGRNRSNLTLTPVAGQSSLAGTFIASAGTFVSGPVPKTRASRNVVLGNWTDATITSAAPGADMTIVAGIGSAANQTSFVTTLTGYQALNAPPVPDPGSTRSLPEDSAAFDITVSATDPDGDPLGFSVVTGPQHGVVGSFTAASCSGTPSTCTATISYTPTADYNGGDSFEFRASDAYESGTATVPITVTPVNDGPVNTVPGAQTVQEHTALIFSAENGNAISVAHVDGGPLSVTLTATDGTLTLGSTTGLTVTGDGSSEVQLTGGPTDVNNGLAGLQFNPAPGYSGPATITITTSDLGNTGSGGILTDTDTVAVTVGAVNDPPVNHLPSPPPAVDEDSVLALPGTLWVSDPDAGSGEVVVTLAGFHGTLSVTGTPGVTVTGDGNPELVLAGTIENLNTALATLTFTPDADYAGSAASITMTTDDQGNTGGAAQTDTDILDVTVNPVNDAPVNSVPGAQTVAEDADLVFSAANGNRIAVSDVDAGTGPVQVILSASDGTLIPGGTAGLSVTGSGTGTLTVTGTITDVNTGLDGLRFTPSGGFSGTATITVTTSDLGHTGSGGTLSTSDTVAVTVGAVNDPPVNSLPSPPAAIEDTPLVMSGGGAISVSDPDAGSNPVRVTLTATHGLLTLSGTTGLNVTGDGTATVVLTGPLGSVNAALDGMIFAPAPDYAGPASISVLTDDQGNSGSGGPLSDSDTLIFTVSAVNDAPFNVVPGAQTVSEDTGLAFSAANGNRITVADVDAGAGPLQVTLSATGGTLTLGGTTGLVVTGDGSGTVTLTGAPTDVNDGLDGLWFMPAGGYSGAVTITVTTSDLGHTGSGGALTDTDTVAVSVDAVNDAPVNVLPLPPSAAEDTPLVMSGGGAISVWDPDAGTGSIAVTLTATNGILTLNGTTGLSVTGDGTATVVLAGPLGSVNAALDGMTFLAQADYSGPASIAIATDDQGNTGSGGPRSASDTLIFTVSAVNDPPVNTVPGPQSVNESSDLLFTTTNGNQISVSDVDAGSGIVQVTLSATNATLYTERTTGLQSISPPGQHAATIVFTGPVAGVNTALNYLHFTPTPGYFGTASLVITTNDQGNTGSGGAQTDQDPIAVTVARLNRAPVISLPAAPSVDEDAVLTLAGAGAMQISDPDAGPAAVEVQLSSTDGTMTLDGTAGLTFSAGDGTADAAMTFTGAIGDINAALDGMTYTPTANFAGSVSIGLTANDLGNTGAGGPQTNSETLTVTVNAVNDAPVNTVPGLQTINEDTELVFSTGNGNAISVAHVDAGTVQVSLAATNGTLTLGSIPGGLVFSAGDGTADTAMTFTGSVADVNTALTGLRFTPTPEASGPASLSITTDDQGNTGTGGALADTDTVEITVNAVNDPPVNQLPAAPSTPEDTPLTLSGSAAISISDADAGTSPVEVALSATNGTLTLDGSAGLTFTAGDGTADAAMTFTGAISDVNTALDGVTYTPAANFNGSAAIAVTTNDQGNTGPDGAKGDSDSLTVTVSAVNDAPVTTAPSSMSINEDTDAVFSVAGGPAITVADVDAATVRVSLSAAYGTVTLHATTGLSFTAGDGTSDAFMTFSGAINDVNAALDGLVYRPDPNFNNSRGSAGLTITSGDLGNTGSGGPQSDTDSVAISVGPVADAPVAAAHTYASGAVQTNMKRTGVGNLLDGATDPDSGDSGYTPAFTIACGSTTTPVGGTVTCSSSGVLDFDPPPGVTGDVTFTYTITDNGYPGPGMISAAATVTVNVAGPVIWFVDPAVAANGNGRLSTPFKYLATAGTNNDPGDVDATGHRVFIYSGTASGGIALNANEWLIGQGATAASFDTLFGISPPAGTIARPTLSGTRPAMTGSVTLANDTAVRGLNITPIGSTQGLIGTGVAGIAVSEVSVATVSATAVNLANSDGTFAFTAVSANGGTNGIAWSNTTLQATGSLTVAGTGTANSGGIIQNTTGDGISLLRADEVSLSRMLISHPAGDGVNATSVTGLTVAGSTIEFTGDDGIALNATSSVSLSGMTISTTGGDGISGTGVTNLTVSGGSITGAGNGDDEDALGFDTVGAQNLSGTLSITDATISGFEEKGLSVTNSAGSLAITITNTNFSDNDDVNGNDAINVATTGSAGATLSVSGGTFDNIETAAVGFDAAGSGTHDVDIVGITATNQGGPDNNPADAYIRLSAQDQHTLTFDIRGNTLQNTHGDGIVVMGDGTVNGRIGGPTTSDGNTITGDNPGIGDGIRIDMDGYFGQSASPATFTWTLLVQHNTIAVGNASGWSDQGIQVLNRDHTGTLNLTIADNSISNTGTEGVRYFSGDRQGLGSPRGVVAVKNNTFTNTAVAGGSDLSLQTSDTSNACFDITANTLTPGTSDISFSRLDSSSIGITQASLAALGTANSSATVAGSVSSYNQACTPPLPTIP